MRKYLPILVCHLFLTAAPALGADPADFRSNSLELLKSGNPRERSLAIEFLGSPDCATKEGVAYLRLLARTGLHDSSAIVRETALARLRFTLSPDHHGSCRGDDEFIAALLQALHDPSPLVREESLKILGMTHNDRIIPEVSAMLQDSEFTVRQQAAVALGRIGDSRSLPLLLALFPERKEWQDVFVQQEALFSLRMIVNINNRKYADLLRRGDRDADKFKIDVRVLESVKALMVSVADDPWFRQEAFEFFATVATEGARDLLRSASRDADPAIRQLAYDGISRLDATAPKANGCGYAAIATALRDQHPGVRAAAFAKLPACNTEVDKRLLSAHLVDGIDDANRDVNAAALAVATSIGGVDVMQVLVGKFGAEPYETRNKALQVFLEIVRNDRQKAAAAATAAAAESPNESVVFVTDATIQEFPPPQTEPDQNGPSLETQAVAIILARFPSLSLAGKSTALAALGSLDDARIKPFAMSLLNDPQPGLRIRAIFLLGKFDLASVLPQLFELAQGDDWELRSAAIDRLLEAEQLPEAYSLARLAEHPNPAVRNLLVRSLRQYYVGHGNRISPALRDLTVKMLDDPDFKIRQMVTGYFQDGFDRSNIDKLAQILAKDGNCSNAAFALAALGDPRGMDALYEICKGVCEAQKVDLLPGKRAAAVALGKAKDPRATPLLCDMLEHGNDDEYQLVGQLGLTYDKNAAPCLVAYGKKQKNGVAVMFALGRIASPEALDFLQESLDTYQYNSVVLYETIRAIAATPGTRSLDILLGEMRNNPNQTNVLRYALADRALRDPEALSYLFGMAGKEPQAFGSLSTDIGFRAVPVPPLQKQIMSLAEGGERNVRLGAIIALGSFRDSQSLEFLEKLATDHDKDVAGLAELSLNTRNQRSKGARP